MIPPTIPKWSLFKGNPAFSLGAHDLSLHDQNPCSIAFSRTWQWFQSSWAYHQLNQAGAMINWFTAIVVGKICRKPLQLMVITRVFLVDFRIRRSSDWIVMVIQKPWNLQTGLAFPDGIIWDGSATPQNVTGAKRRKVRWWYLYHNWWISWESRFR